VAQEQQLEIVRHLEERLEGEEKKMAKAYKVVFELGEDGLWSVSVPAVRGCRSQGKSIAQARDRIREALGLFVDDADDAEFREDLKLPATLKRTLHAYHGARKRAQAEKEKAQARARESVRILKKAGFTVRDAGELLELSHQRVQQLLEAS
jgi:predicted RNase H-like HicB family nuclease